MQDSGFIASIAWILIFTGNFRESQRWHARAAFWTSLFYSTPYTWTLQIPLACQSQLQCTFGTLDVGAWFTGYRRERNFILAALIRQFELSSSGRCDILVFTSAADRTWWFTNLAIILTYSTVQSPSWAATWFAASQEVPRISRNLKVHYRTHKRPPPVSILGQTNPVHMPISHLLEIHPNIIHPSTPKSVNYQKAKIVLYRIWYHHTL